MWKVCCCFCFFPLLLSCKPFCMYICKLHTSEVSVLEWSQTDYINKKCKSSLYLFVTQAKTHTILGNTRTCSLLDSVTKSISLLVVWTVGESLLNIVSGFSPFLSSSFCVSFTERLFITPPWRPFLPSLISEGQKEKKRAECLSTNRTMTLHRDLWPVYIPQNLHNNLSEVKGGRAKRKIAHMKERIKGRNVGR